jgi:hypothetical protein
MEAKKGNNWIIIILGSILLCYTGVRTWELMSMTLPPEFWWVAVFALVALDVGVVLWAAYYVHYAQSKAQEVIAIIMVVACLLGVGLAVLGDTLLQASKRDFASAKTDIAYWAIVVQAAIVFLNVVMATTVHMISPDAQQLRRRRRIYYDIEERKLDALAKNAEKFAPETAQVHADKWLEDERAQIRPLQLRGRSMPVYNRPTKGQIITLKSIKKPDYAADGGNPVIDTEKEDEQPEMQGPFSLNSQVQPFQGRIKRQK